jgi:hypothetical protein
MIASTVYGIYSEGKFTKILPRLTQLYRWKVKGMYQRHQTLNVSFSLKLTCKGTWRQVFICLRPLPS